MQYAARSIRRAFPDLHNPARGCTSARQGVHAEHCRASQGPGSRTQHGDRRYRPVIVILDAGDVRHAVVTAVPAIKAIHLHNP